MSNGNVEEQNDSQEQQTPAAAAPASDDTPNIQLDLSKSVPVTQDTSEIKLDLNKSIPVTAPKTPSLPTGSYQIRKGGPIVNLITAGQQPGQITVHNPITPLPGEEFEDTMKRAIQAAKSLTPKEIKEEEDENLKQAPGTLASAVALGAAGPIVYGGAKGVSILKQALVGGDSQILGHPENMMTPDSKKAHPYWAGAMELAGGLSDPENAAMIIGSGALGKLPSAASKVAGRLVSGGFGINMLSNAVRTVPELWDVIRGSGKYADMSADDRESLAKKMVFQTTAQGAMATQALEHATTGESHALTGVGEQADAFAAHKAGQVVNAVKQGAGAAAEAISAAPSKAVDAIGSLIGRTNDFDTAIQRSSKIPSKQATAHAEKIANVREDLQAILNDNAGKITSPKEFADKIDDHIHDNIENKLQAAAGTTKGSSDSVVPNVEKRLSDRLDKFFDDHRGLYGDDQDTLAAKKKLIEGVLKTRGDQHLQDPNLFEAENDRRRLNRESKPQYATNATPTTDAYKAGALETANELRQMIDENYKSKGIEGVKEARQKEADLIDVRDRLYDAVDKSNKMGEGRIFDSLMAKIGVPSTVVAIALGHPLSVPAIGAAVLGDQIRQNITNPNVNVGRAADIAAKVPGAKATVPTFSPTAQPRPAAPPVQLSPVSRQFTLLHSALATHYGEVVGQSTYPELAGRFMAETAAKAQRGTPLEPAEKVLLGKMNDAHVAEAQKAADEAKEAADKKRIESEKQEAATAKAAADKEANDKKLRELGLKTNMAPPFEAEPHQELPDIWQAVGSTGYNTATHELGHHFQAAKYGHVTKDIIGHQHPLIDDGAAAEARWDNSAFKDEKGKVTVDSIKPKLEELLDILHGGAVAEEVVHGKPVHLNYGAGSDLEQVDAILNGIGFSPSEIGQMTEASQARVRSDFERPGVADIFKRYTQLREKGIDPRLLMSERTSGRAIQEFKNTLEGGNEPNDKQEASGRGGASGTKGKAGGASATAGGDKGKNGPAGKAGEGAGSSGAERGIKTNVKAGVVGRTTGSAEDDAAIKKGGGIPGGVMDFGEFGKIRMFHEPETGTTLGFKNDEKITPESVKSKLDESRKTYGLKTNMAAAEEPETVAEHANAFNKTKGRPPVNAEPIPHNPEIANRISQAYEAMPHNPESPAVQKAYNAAKKDIDDQWNYAVNNIGVKFEPWVDEGQPYANSKEMMKDVKDNKHLYFFRGGEIPTDHPLAAIDPKTGFSYNDKLRAVHDLFGHAAHGFQFGPKGEENAWNVHRQMFSPEAVPAMTTETRGQNSWVNFGEHLRTAEGKIPAKGEQGYIPPAERPYAQEKANVLPEEFHRPTGVYHPDLQKVIDKNEIQAYMPTGASFITPDGRFVKLSETHPEAIEAATEKPFNDASLSEKIGNESPHTEDNRVKFLNDTGAIRSRIRQTQAGSELVLSVPKQGVTPEQIEAIKKSVGKVRNGSIVIERADVSSETKDQLTAQKDFPNQSDIDEMLHKISAHPDKDWADKIDLQQTKPKKASREEGFETTAKNKITVGARDLFPESDHTDERSYIEPNGVFRSVIDNDHFGVSALYPKEDLHDEEAINRFMDDTGFLRTGAYDRSFLIHGGKQVPTDDQLAAAVKQLKHWSPEVSDKIMIETPYGSKDLPEFARPGEIRREIAKLYNQKATPPQNWADKIDLKQDPAGGINPRTGSMDSKRYGVEIYPEVAKKLDHPPTAEDFRDYAKEHGAILDKHPDMKIGWDTLGNKPEMNIGISSDDLDAVKKVGAKLDQRSVWDTQEKKEIPTGGANTKREFPGYPLEARLRDVSGAGAFRRQRAAPPMKRLRP